MADQAKTAEPPLGEWVPEARTSRAARLSIIWAIPFVAALVAGWLVWTTLAERGPEVVITFRTGEGLEPGRTKVKYREVEVGTVERVQIAADLSGVIVTARLVRGAERLLAADSRFWVVRPRVGVGGISGLGTLVSGAYVEVDPGRAEKIAYSFVGLEEPPPIRLDEPGRSFVLEARELDGVHRGSPVYYRDIEVGRVLGVELVPTERALEVLVFVRAPYDRLVTRRTRFWNASGIEFAAGGSGIEVRLQSVQALVAGGIAFDSPKPGEEPAPAGTRFTLYPSERSLEEATFAQGDPYLLYFDTSVRGLRPGARVEFRGMPVGRVTDVDLQFDPRTSEVRVPVVIEIQPQRFTLVGGGDASALDVDTMAGLVRRGLRARLESSNLLTGELVVALDFVPEAAPAELDRSGALPVLPTLPTELEALTASLQGALERLASLPLDALVAELRGAIAEVRQLAADPRIGRTLTAIDEAARNLARTAARLETDVVPLVARLREVADRTAGAAREAEAAFETTRDFLGPGSRLRYDLAQLTREVTAAARSIRDFVDYLERNPQALISGRAR